MNCRKSCNISRTFSSGKSFCNVVRDRFKRIVVTALEKAAELRGNSSLDSSWSSDDKCPSPPVTGCPMFLARTRLRDVPINNIEEDVEFVTNVGSNRSITL